MTTESILSELKILISSKIGMSELAEKLGVDRSVIYRMIQRKDMPLSRLLDILDVLQVEPAGFFAGVGGKTIIEGTLLDLEFRINSDKLKIELLEKKLAECQSKANH